MSQEINVCPLGMAPPSDALFISLKNKRSNFAEKWQTCSMQWSFFSQKRWYSSLFFFTSVTTLFFSRQGANVSLAMLSSNPWFHSPLHTYVVNQCRFFLEMFCSWIHMLYFISFQIPHLGLPHLFLWHCLWTWGLALEACKYFCIFFSVHFNYHHKVNFVVYASHFIFMDNIVLMSQAIIIGSNIMFDEQLL